MAVNGTLERERTTEVAASASRSFAGDRDMRYELMASEVHEGVDIRSGSKQRLELDYARWDGDSRDDRRRRPGERLVEDSGAGPPAQSAGA